LDAFVVPQTLLLQVRCWQVFDGCGQSEACRQPTQVPEPLQTPVLHGEPATFGGFEHWPVTPSQVPALWHSSRAVQTTGLPPWQTPPWQMSLWVQALPSLHAVPSALVGFEHTPVAGLHVPTLWHWSC
jgi:hypothetical protein